MRKRSGLTQEQLAARTAIGVTTIRDLEQGRTRRLRPDSLRRMADVLGAPLGEDIRLHILGPLRVIGVTIGPHRQRAVLGLLALSPGRPVHRESIIDALWGDNPPASAVNAVQGYVSRLRRSLQPFGPDLLASVPQGYRLQVSEDQLDLLTFRRLVEQARQAARRGALAAACDLYGQAMALWRDEPLADVPLLRGNPAILALVTERVTATLEYADAAAALGRHAPVLPLLRAITRAEPLHGAVHARLMIALAGSGHQAAALRVFADIRARLADELGVDPDPDLVEAHRLVLRQEIRRPAARVAPTPPAAIVHIADHYVAVGRRLTRMLGGGVGRGAAEAIGWLDVEREGVLSALRQAAALPGRDAGAAVRLAVTLTDLFDIRGYLRDGITLNRTGAEVARRLGDRRAEALLLMCLGLGHGRLAEYDAEARLIDRALALWRDLGDPFGESGALMARGIAYLHRRRPVQAMSSLERSQTIRREYGRQSGIALTVLGRAYGRLGDIDRAMRSYEDALADARTTGFRWGEGYALGHLAESLRLTGRLDESAVHHKTSLAIYRDYGDRCGQAAQLWGLGAALHDMGDTGAARSHRHDALIVLRGTGALTERQLASLGGAAHPETPNLLALT
jgi:DNA-binding SARP family transcriptional activator